MCGSWFFTRVVRRKPSSKVLWKIPFGSVIGHAIDVHLHTDIPDIHLFPQPSRLISHLLALPGSPLVFSVSNQKCQLHQHISSIDAVTEAPEAFSQQDRSVAFSEGLLQQSDESIQSVHKSKNTYYVYYYIHSRICDIMIPT